MNDFKNLLVDALASDADKVIITQPIHHQHSWAIPQTSHHLPLSPVASGSTDLASLAATTFDVPAERGENQGQHPSPSVPEERTLPALATPAEQQPSEQVLPPETDQTKMLREASAKRNAVSGYIESEERLEKHYRKRYDDDQLNFLRSQLAMLPIQPLQKSLEVTATFPIESFPQAAAQYARDMSAAIGTPIEMVGTGLFGGFFAAIGGTCRSREANGHSELANEYFLISSPSGTRKSEVVEHICKPIEMVQSERRREFSRSTSEANNNARLAAIKKLETDANRKIVEYIDEGGDAESAINVTCSDFTRIELLKKALAKCQSEPKLLFDRVTMTQLPFEMANQEGVAAIIDAEAAILQKICPNNDSILLKGSTGEAFSSATRNSGSVDIDEPCLTLCLYGQPDKIDDFYSNTKLVGHGLAARTLPVFVSARRNCNSHIATAPSQQSVDWYDATIRRLLSIRRQEVDGKMKARIFLELTSDANSALASFRRQIAAEVDSGRFEYCEAFASKLPGHACRLAVALRMMQNPNVDDLTIDERAMRGGITFAKYFCQHALVAFDPSACDGITYAPNILKHIKDERRDQVTVRDAQRWIGSGRHSALQAKAGLDELEKRDLLRRYITTTRSTVYVVHPSA